MVIIGLQRRKYMINKKTIISIMGSMILIIILILFKLEIYRYDQIDRGNYEELMKTNKITGQSYIFTDDGWETQESILKKQNDIEINKYNKEIGVLNEKVESAEQILNNLDEYTESIEHYNVILNGYSDKKKSRSYSATRIYAFGWEDETDRRIYDIIDLEGVIYYAGKDFSFEDAIKDKIENYKKDIADMESKIIELENIS